MKFNIISKVFYLEIEKGNLIFIVWPPLYNKKGAFIALGLNFEDKIR